MSAILPFVQIDSGSLLARYFTSYQIAWIEAEDPFHQAKKQVFALAEKSVRIGWTFCDGFKNVRKRLRFKNRDYLFATKDLPSALEYMNDIYNFADMLGYTRAVLSHGEDFIKVKSLDPEGNPTALSEEVKIGYIKFENGSRIIAFSSNPYAMAVYGGDVGLDEFAKHPNASLLWQTAQARVTWGCDLAVWSSHDGEDTLFNQFAQQARAACSPGPSASPTPPPASPPPIPDPKPPVKTSPWNLYFRVTMEDAVELGVVDVINRTKGTEINAQEFLSDCRLRSGSDEIYQQSYMCNPLGAAASHIVEWSAIERCRAFYQIERLHFEADEVRRLFGEFAPDKAQQRESTIASHLLRQMPILLGDKASTDSSSSSEKPLRKRQLRIGFDVAASGQGDLAAIYIDEAKGPQLWLRALLTCRTEDWHFLKTVLFHLLKSLPSATAAGDESGLGRQICWEAAQRFGARFLKVNFAARKHDLGMALMNHLSEVGKWIPHSHADIAQDYFALRKTHTGTRWAFSEGRNLLNPVSHCDIAWAGALASLAHTEKKSTIGIAVVGDNGWFDGNTFHPYNSGQSLSPEAAMLWSDDPRIWRRL